MTDYVTIYRPWRMEIFTTFICNSASVHDWLTYCQHISYSFCKGSWVRRSFWTPYKAFYQCQSTNFQKIVYYADYLQIKLNNNKINSSDSVCSNCYVLIVDDYKITEADECNEQEIDESEQIQVGSSGGDLYQIPRLCWFCVDEFKNELINQLK